MNRIALWTGLLIAQLASLKEEGGQALVEYGLILSLIAVAVVVILNTIGTNLNTILTTISNDL